MRRARPDTYNHSNATMTVKTRWIFCFGANATQSYRVSIRAK
jgi:hypothetical protein